VADWVTISALASAGGTLVLAGVTVASVRSANRAARVAERSLLAGQRPLLVQSRTDDPTQQAGFADDVWLIARGGQGDARATDQAIYFAIGVRNVGTGIAVLHGWHLFPELELRPDTTPTPRGDFTMLSRDLYIAPEDVGFWQGAFRDPSIGDYRDARRAVEEPHRIAVDILYGDFEGGQRVITRFLLSPREVDDDLRWFAGVGRHWNVDLPQPREH
jgi:hypothetical protein